MNKLILIIAYLFIFCGQSFAFGSKPHHLKSYVVPDCFTSDPAEKQILQQFEFVSDYQGKFDPDFCNVNSIGNKAAKALLFIHSIADMSGFPASDIDQKIISTSPYEFLNSRAHTIVFNQSWDVDCSGLTLAYVDEDESDTMHLCPNITGADVVYMSSAMIHEARHLDWGHYHHTSCNHGFYASRGNVDACDESYETKGSYAVQTEYMVKVSKADHVDPAIRQDARSDAALSFMDRFNKLPLGIKKGALLLSNDLKVSFYDGARATDILSLPDSMTKLFLNADAIGFYNSRTDSISMVNVGSEFEKENSIKKPTESGEIVDLFLDLHTSCLLFTDHIRCRFDSGSQRVVLPIKDFTPVGFVSNYDPFGTQVFVMSKEGKRYSVSPDSTAFKEEGDSKYLNTASWDDTKGSFLVLSQEGKVLIQNGNDESNVSIAPGLNSSVFFTKSVAPYYWSSRLNDL